MTIESLGIDIAKNVLQLHDVNSYGRVLLKRRVMRDQLLAVMAQIERCTIAIEACTGAFCWAPKFEALGHEVKIISPQYVKPFVRRQKNDGNDAEAICTAARQPHIPLVPKKTVEQQDIQALHRARQRMVNHRTAVISQIRGLLLDRGLAMAKSITRAQRSIPELLSDLENELTTLAREAVAELYDQFRYLDRRIQIFDHKIQAVFRASEPCQRIARIKGVGPKTATAVVAAISACRRAKAICSFVHRLRGMASVLREAQDAQKLLDNWTRFQGQDQQGLCGPVGVSAVSRPACDCAAPVQATAES